MKHFISKVVLLSAIASTASAVTVEFSQLPFVSLGAPLPYASFGTTYFPIVPTYHTTLKSWGYGTPTGTIVPSIGFGVDDYPGTTKSCSGNYPKHLGTDYAAPSGTQVFAIADGFVRRSNAFTGTGDYYVVVESGSTDKWTTLYGHLNPTSFGIGTNLNIQVTKGALIGTLFNYHDFGDIPHLHMGIHKGAYNGTGEANMGYVCPNTQYQLNKYNFVSPEPFNYYTPFY